MKRPVGKPKLYRQGSGDGLAIWWEDGKVSATALVCLTLAELAEHFKFPCENVMQYHEGSVRAWMYLVRFDKTSEEWCEGIERGDLVPVEHLVELKLAKI